MLPNPLNITDTSNVAPINRFAREVNTSLSEVQTELKRQNTAIIKAQETATTAFTGSVALAADVSAVSASENGFIVDGVLWSEVTCSYTAPNPLGTFAGVFLVIQNYNGSSELVKVTEHHYTGSGGGSAHFKVILQRTNETVTLFFVATNKDSDTVADWSSEPHTTVVLDGNASAPTAPTSFTGSSQQLGVLLSWDENIEDNIKGYNLWRNVTNNAGTADNIAVIAANGLGTGKATYFDKETLLGTTYWYWVTAVDNIGLESTKAGPVSLTADTVSLEDEAADGPTRGAITAANSSYRPLTNPLTAHDNGVSAEIDIASFVMRTAIGPRDITLNSGVVSGLSYNTVYHVYYDDPTYAGGSVTYFANTTQAIALDATGRFYVGSILTPVAGGADTTGNNDGGTGAQSGQLYLLSPSLRADDSTDPVSWYPANDLDSDGDTSTFVSVTALLISWLGGWPQISSKWTSLKLKVHSAVPSVDQGGTAFVDYSLDDGTTWTNIYSVQNGTADLESASAAANDGLTGTAWTNPGNLATSDSYATITGAAHGTESQFDKATGFPFALPSGSTVLGITAKCDDVIGGNATETPQLVFRLLKAGTPVGNTRTVNAIVPSGTPSAGDTDDLWGATWTDTDINDPNFGVEIAASAPTPASTWVSNTYYSPLGVIIDSNGNLQQIVTPGISGTTVTWATSLGGTTTDGTITWKLIQLAASLVWTAGHTYNPGDFIVASASGVNHLFQLDSGGSLMPRLVAGTHAYVWSGAGGAGTSAGAFNKTFPQGSAPSGFDPSSLHWVGGVGIDLSYYDINGNGTLGTAHDTGFYENWQTAIVGQLFFPAAGQYSFQFTQDDGMLIGFEDGISKISGNLSNPRGQTRTAKQGYTILAGVNTGGSYISALTINVPTAGAWGFEIDYSNWEHKGEMVMQCLDSTGTYQDIIPQATALTSDAIAPAWPTWSTAFAPSYPSVVETNGNYIWLNRGPATDFSWQATTSFAAPGLTILDSNLNGQTPYRAGLSSSGVQPTWSTVLNTLTNDAASLIWLETGATSSTTTFDFNIRNAVIQVTYVAPSSPSSRAITTDEVTLPITQNLGRVQVRYGFVTEAGEQDIYEVWIEAQAG